MWSSKAVAMSKCQERKPYPSKIDVWRRDAPTETSEGKGVWSIMTAAMIFQLLAKYEPYR